jgi:cobalt-zinc-cadmium efflux system outer membrane protein
MPHAARALAAAAALVVVATGGARAQFAASCAAPVPVPLSLAAAEARLAACNREVDAARLAHDAAAADLRIARQRPNPSLTLGASNVNPHAGIGAGALRDKTVDSSVRVEQLVERGGKAQLRVEQARALLAASAADIAEQLRAQRLALRTAFFDLAAAQEKARLQREFRRLSEASADASRRRFEAGDIPRVEADRFRLDAVRAANDERQSQSDLQRARAELARLLASEAQADALEVTPVWPDAPSRAPAAERADVRAARLRLEAAERSRDLARSLATRDLTVGMQADRWPVSETNTQGTGISYSLSVSFPLQVRHANEGEALRALADLAAARAALAKAQAQAASDGRVSEEEWRAASERRRRAEEEVAPAARDLAQGAEFAYAHGASGVLELLDARRSLKSVELDEVQLRAEAAKAWARREAAVDGAEE